MIFEQSGGRDTAGQGGRGGYKRLSKGHAIKQVLVPFTEPISVTIPIPCLSRFLPNSKKTYPMKYVNEPKKWPGKSSLGV